MTEIRFEAPGWKHYGWGLAFFGLGLVFVAWGVLGIVWNPLGWSGFLYVVAGFGVAVVGLLFAGLVLLIYVGGTIAAWRTWRQLRAPAVLVDVSGVSYLAPRRPLAIPWTEAEQVLLRRSILRNGVVNTRFYVGLRPGSRALEGGSIAMPADRVLKIGAMSQVSAPEDAVVRFLEENSGCPLEVTVRDRRPSGADVSRA